MESIQRPNYSKYALMTRIPFYDACSLIASLQLNDNDYSDLDTYTNTRREKGTIARCILDEAIKYGDIEIYGYVAKSENGKVTLDVLGNPIMDEEDTYFYMSDLCEWAQYKNLHLPDQLKTLIDPDLLSNVEKQSPEKKLRKDQIAKIKCQAIGRYLWSLNPDLTIVEMINHPAILEFGDGKHYPGKNTLRDWLSEVDPRPSEEKTGPKKTEP